MADVKAPAGPPPRPTAPPVGHHHTPTPAPAPTPPAPTPTPADPTPPAVDNTDYTTPIGYYVAVYGAPGLKARQWAYATPTGLVMQEDYAPTKGSLDDVTLNKDQIADVLLSWIKKDVSTEVWGRYAVKPRATKKPAEAAPTPPTAPAAPPSPTGQAQF